MILDVVIIGNMVRPGKKLVNKDA